MTFGVYLSQMVENLFNAKMRSFLAVLGIMVGSASVVALVSGGELATRNALIQFESLGTNLLSLSIEQSGSSTTILPSEIVTPKDIATVQRNIPQVTNAAGYVNLYLPISYKGNNIDGSIIGANENLADIVKVNIVAGRFVSYLDRDAYFCVLGHDVAQSVRKYFGVGNLVGKQIALGNKIFTIIGVMGRWQETPFLSGDLNSAVVVPLKTSFYLSKYAQIHHVIFHLRKNIDIGQVQDDITNEFNKLVIGQRFFYRSSQQIIASMDNQHRTFTWMLGFIGSISLLVGGIGVMNIMLVSVTERRREIGIRRAIGARSLDIQYMFVLESVGLTMFGGIVGVLVGVFVSFLIADFAHWQFSILPLPPIIGFMVSALTGIFFGYYPALKASRLNPIEALRSE